MSATDRAFQLPELLAAILKRVQMTERSRDRDRSLLACCLVNSIWFSAAMPLLWASPTDRYVVETMWPTLPLLFSRIEPARRQMYADAVKNACLMSAERFAPYDEAIQGVSFPALRTLTVYLDDGHHVPTVKGHQVRGLTLNPRFDVNPDTYGVDRDDIETILDQIAVSCRRWARCARRR